MTNHQPSGETLFASLLHARGNQRACIYTEPLWGIPYNLYAPFASIFMLALGIQDAAIGLIASFGLGLQIVTSILSGPLTDKLGRKRATLIFDLLSWSVPALLWAFARNATWFYLAAAFNSLLRVPTVSWTCLLVEDARKEKLVHYWTWVMVAGLISGFVTPVAGLLIERFELIPTMRAFYLFTFISMTSKFIILNIVAEETTQGRVRLQETSDVGVLTLTRESLTLLPRVFRDRGTMVAVVALAMYAIYSTVRGTFFAVYLTQGLAFRPEEIGWFPALRSLVMLFFFLVVIPRLNQHRYIGALLVGIGGLVVGNLLLVVAGTRGTALVLASTVVDAAGAAILTPFLEGFVAAVVDHRERARILAIANTVVLAVASPFGWIAGVLSERNRSLPFILIIVVLAVTIVIILAANPERRTTRPDPARNGA